MSIRSYKNSHPKHDASVYIDKAAVVIGDVKLGADVSVWPTTVIRGDVNKIKIGDRTNVQDGSVLHVTHDSSEFSPGGSDLQVGKDVTIGHRVVLHACHVGDLCLIGMGSVVLDDAVIEKEVIVGANSLVPPGKRLKSGYLYVGSPVKQSRLLTDHEKKFLKYSAKHYVALKNQYLK